MKTVMFGSKPALAREALLSGTVEILYHNGVKVTNRWVAHEAVREVSLDRWEKECARRGHTALVAEYYRK